MLERVREDVIERIVNPEVGKVYLADPRQFSISPHNVRIDPEREIKRLEDSILKVGFRSPIRSDLNYNIIAGGRRWRIALKHGLKIPVIFVNYESDAEKHLDVFLDNASTHLTLEEMRRIFLQLDSMGYSLKDIAEMTGQTEETICIVLRGPLPEQPRIQPDRTKWRLRSAKTFARRLLEERFSLQQVKKILKEVSELPMTQIKQLEKEARLGLAIDIEKRVKKGEMEEIHILIAKDLFNAFIDMIRGRNMDLVRTINVLLKLFTSGKIEISQSDYESSSQ
jgi:ParB-like chromosome segregation protein Spo0J